MPNVLRVLSTLYPMDKSNPWLITITVTIIIVIIIIISSLDLSMLKIACLCLTIQDAMPEKPMIQVSRRKRRDMSIRSPPHVIGLMPFSTSL